MARYYYAQYDWTIGEGNPGYGFSNTKGAVAFSTKNQADNFVRVRSCYDFSCKRITRADAYTMKEPVDNYPSMAYRVLRYGDRPLGVKLFTSDFCEYLGINEAEA